jgi:hypothetical protein
LVYQLCEHKRDAGDVAIRPIIPQGSPLSPLLEAPPSVLSASRTLYRAVTKAA